jgi:hypothetical protein
MARIAISYRRDDSLDITGRIFDRLSEHFGREAVFRDIDNIPPGVDFRRHIDRVLDESDIVLAIVGPRWVGPDDEQRRLTSPVDPVRLEIETALQKNKPLIPVLVSRAVMPPPDALPDSLLDFGYRNAVRVDGGEDFDVHVSRLIRGMEQILQIGEDPAADQAGRGVIAAVDAATRTEPPPTADAPIAPVPRPVGRPVRANASHTVRWAMGLGLVAMLGVIGAGGWWVFVEQPAEMARQEAGAAENARTTKQARQAAASATAPVEDALRKTPTNFCGSMTVSNTETQVGNDDSLYDVHFDFRRGQEQIDRRACGREIWTPQDKTHPQFGVKFVYLVDGYKRRTLQRLYVEKPDGALGLPQ